MSSKPPTLPHSLVNPNFSGLWSTNHSGKENDICTVLIGALALHTFIYAWIVGLFSPVIILALFYLKYTLTALLLTTVLVYPYVVRVQEWPAWQRFMFKGCGYFEGGSSLSFEHEIDFDEPILFGVHPHGMFTFGAFFSGMRGVVLSEKEFSASKPKLLTQLGGCALVDKFLAIAPIFKHLIIHWASGRRFRSASKQSMMKLLRERKLSLYLVVGGFNEAALLKKDFDCVYIKDRKGFIKYALKCGSCVLPAYTFGECSTYNTILSGQNKLKTWLTSNRIPCVFPYGPFAWCCSLLPYRKNVGLHTIYGNLKKFPCIEQPTKEDIDTYHKWYVDELCRIFNDNKWRFGITHELVVF